MKKSIQTKKFKWHNMARFKNIASRCDVQQLLEEERKG